MTEVPAEYHDFADVFSDTLSEKLPEHRPLRPSRSILRKELLLRLGQFTPSRSLSSKPYVSLIDDNLRIGFITPSRSPPWSSSAFC